MRMKKTYYGQYIIRTCGSGYFAEPINPDPNKDRWGNSPTMSSRIAVEAWIDFQSDTPSGLATRPEPRIK